MKSHFAPSEMLLLTGPCPTDFGKLGQAPIYRFRTSIADELSPQFLSHVRASPQFASLKNTFGNGADLEFVVVHHDAERLKAATLDPKLLGESTQAAFVVRLLKQVFPEAKILETSPTMKPAAPGTERVRLTIEDRAETGIERSNTVLEMSRLKLANPGAPPADRKSVRDALGFTESHKIVSLNNSIYNSADQVAELAANLMKEPVDALIISQSDIFENIDYTAFQKNFGDKKFQVLKLSELGITPRDPLKRLIAINDVQGRMHVVYAASDLNVVAGAVNLAEPTLAGTPSIVFDARSPYLHGYNESVFNEMLDHMKQTGAVSSVEAKSGSLAAAGQAVREALIRNTAGRSFAPPYATPMRSGEPSPIDLLLRDIECIAVTQTRRPTKSCK